MKMFRVLISVLLIGLTGSLFSIAMAADTQGSCADIGGKWKFSDQQLSTSCGEGVRSLNYEMEIRQDGCQVQLLPFNVSGKVKGHLITLSGFTYPSPDNSDFSIHIKPHTANLEGNNLSCEVDWYVTYEVDGRKMCVGKTASSAVRLVR